MTATLFDLDTFQPAYPYAAGCRDTDTSRAAAPVDAATIRAQVLETFRTVGAMTADECAERMEMSVLTIRPRCTELKRLGHLHDSGKRRPNASGKSAMILTTRKP